MEDEEKVLVEQKWKIKELTRRIRRKKNQGSREEEDNRRIKERYRELREC